MLPSLTLRVLCKQREFPHSEISGSKVARHLPEAYRSHATSFIATSSQGIHHTPLNFLLGNSKTVILVQAIEVVQEFFPAAWNNIHTAPTIHLQHEKTPRQARDLRPLTNQEICCSGIFLSKNKPVWKRAQLNISVFLTLWPLLGNEFI